MLEIILDSHFAVFQYGLIHTKQKLAIKISVYRNLIDIDPKFNRHRSMTLQNLIKN